jgi:hypothetical protein
MSGSETQSGRWRGIKDVTGSGGPSLSWCGLKIGQACEGCQAQKQAKGIRLEAKLFKCGDQRS